MRYWKIALKLAGGNETVAFGLAAYDQFVFTRYRDFAADAVLMIKPLNWTVSYSRAVSFLGEASRITELFSPGAGEAGERLEPTSPSPSGQNLGVKRLRGADESGSEENNTSGSESEESAQ